MIDTIELRDGIWAIPIPYSSSVPYTLCYVFRDALPAHGVHLIDPGGDIPGNREYLLSALRAIDCAPSDIASITTTHLHPDHLGLAAWLSSLTGLPIGIHEADFADHTSSTATRIYSDDDESLANRWGVPDDQRARIHMPRTVTGEIPLSLPHFIAHDDVLPIRGRNVRALHTPGHTRGHLCFAVDDDTVLLTGDHVLPDINPPIGRGGHAQGESIGEYLDSLDALAPYDDWEVAPGHGYPFTGLHRRRHDIRNHVVTRARHVATALAQGHDASTWHLASTLSWRGGWHSLSAAHLRSALMQVELYRDFVRRPGRWSSVLEQQD